jgi:hypothetical protein
MHVFLHNFSLQLPAEPQARNFKASTVQLQTLHPGYLSSTERFCAQNSPECMPQHSMPCVWLTGPYRGPPVELSPVAEVVFHAAFSIAQQ